MSLDAYLSRLNNDLVRSNRTIAFLNQFEPQERPYIQRLIESFIYLDRTFIKAQLKQHFSSRERLDRVFFVGLGKPTESGSEMITDLRRSMSSDLAVLQFKGSEEINQANLAGFDEIVFLDDFVGTGRQAIEYFDKIEGSISKKVTYACLTGLPSGIGKVEEYLAGRFPRASMETIVKLHLRSAFEPGGVFIQDDECLQAKAICTRYGESLKLREDPAHRSSYPLGYGDSATLFATEYNTPNNTLPIFWSTSSTETGQWVPLFPRASKKSRLSPPPRRSFVLEHKMHEHHKFGSMTVRSIVKYQRFDPPLVSSDVQTTLVQAKALPPVLNEYYESGLDKRVAELISAGKSVTINKGYSLHAARIDKIQVPGRLRRKHVPYLEFEPADYSHQVMFGERINEPGLILEEGAALSIREYMEKNHDVSIAHFDWATVKEIPIPQRFANVVGLIVRRELSDLSKGNCLIATLRSKAMAVSEEAKSGVWHAAMSCAEGMLRPDDAAGGLANAAPTPFNTAKRALETELGVMFGEHYKESDIKLLALAYDGQRCQPIACFLVEALDLDYEAVENLWNTRAEDNNEAPAVFPVPLTPDGISSFIRGDFKWENRTTVMFSNHQQIGLCAVAEHYFDVKALSI